jgi:pyridoxamine 5'-phosphate oxidase
MAEGELSTDKPLLEKEASKDPLVQFRRWYREARMVSPVEPNAMGLATVSGSGFPSLRIVLLKGFDQRGLVFFTNYESRKALEIAQNPHAAAVLYFPELHRQIRVEGRVKQVTPQESDNYFATRERASQIAAAASDQGSVLSSRLELEKRVRRLEGEFEGRDVPRPDYWGGYRLLPTSFEFWQGRSNRLHDRLRYAELADGVWLIERLAP